MERAVACSRRARERERERERERQTDREKDREKGEHGERTGEKRLTSRNQSGCVWSMPSAQNISRSTSSLGASGEINAQRLTPEQTVFHAPVLSGSR
jgi:hypothetical protein